MEKTESNAFILDSTSQRLALDQLLKGKPLFGKGGAFAPMLQQLLQAALEGEMAGHLKEEKLLDEPSDTNRRNGHSVKQLKTSGGLVELSTPRDRNSTFEPELVKKRQTILADSLEEKILGMYGLGMSLRDISTHLEEMYDTSISHTVLSEITDRIIPQVRLWQSHALDAVYCIVWLDAMYYKVRNEEGKVVTRCLYNILGINTDGHKEVLGCYVSESEGARFWLSVLTDLQARGVKDILIACIDNLGGFEEAIVTIFPKTVVQSCIVHQVRNTHKYIASKDSKEAIADIKKVYQAASRQEGEVHLDNFEKRWGKAYPVVVRSWRNNWEKLSAFFEYPEGIRKIIYTTNTIEGYHRQLRKVTKTKGAFVSDMSLLKLVYLASERIALKWTQPLHNWGATAGQLKIIFENRMPMGL